MKKLVALLLSLCLVFGMLAVASAETETKVGKAQGFGSEVTVTITLEDGVITAIEADYSGETFPVAPEDSVLKVLDAIRENNGTEGVDVNTGATFTCTAIVEAANKALAGGEEAAPAGDIAFTAGTYEATAYGYNGNVTANVTFSETKLENIEITTSVETAHVGDVAYDIMIPEMLQANGSGVDTVSGATFTSRAADQAACTNLDAFKANKIEHTAGEPVEVTADVVVVGAGGAGIAAAAQATQNGQTVLVIEKNAEVGGNTLVSGGQFQSVMPYVVWDPADPDAETGVYAHNGQTYNKYKSVNGCINELKMILNWSEEPFDEEYYKDNEFVAGDAAELSKHGVHQEYLPVLQELKKEIQAYLDWAQPKLDSGIDESQLALFSTLNLHIFHPLLHPEPAYLPNLLRRPAPERGQVPVDLWRYRPGQAVHQRRPGSEGVAGRPGRSLPRRSAEHPDRCSLVS